jgi:pimeloyl-ACP methyl ester carboxylesterase
VPYAKNALDGSRVYFEDDGGSGAPVVMHGGFLDSIATVRGSDLATALHDEFRLIFVDHRGLGRSDKPHDPDAYAMPLRVADAVAVIDELGIERANFIGMSWGGRLVFGVGEHASDRVLGLVMSGQQPYTWPDSPLTRVVTEGLIATRTQGMEALIRGMEAFWEMRFPDALRKPYLDNDPAALEAAWTKVLAEGPVSERLHEWRMPCLIFMGAGDTDFIEQAKRAAEEIPTAEFISIAEKDHITAHMSQSETLVEAVGRTLRAG